MTTFLSRPAAGRARVTRRTALGLGLVGLVPALAGCTVPFTASERGVYVIDRDEPELRRVASGSPWLAWSDDSEQLALRYDDGSLQVVGVEGGTPHPYAGGAFIGPGWSPDGTAIAVVDPEQNVIRIESPTGDVMSQAPLREAIPPLWTVAAIEENIPVWSPDGRAIAFLAWDGHGDALYTVSPNGTDRLKLTDIWVSQNRVDRYDWLGQRAAIGDVSTPTWSPDGRFLAYALFPEVRDVTGGIFIVPATGGWSLRVTDLAPTSDPVWSPDGRQLAFSARETSDRLTIASGIFVAAIGRAAVHNLTLGLDLTARDPAWAPDGLHLAFVAEGDLFVIGEDGATRPLVRTELMIRRLAWSPDSTKLAFVGLPAQPGR